MLKRQLHLAQDFIENALRHPQHQSREAGSCMGANRNGVSETQIAALGRWELGLAVNASCQEAVRRLRRVEFSVASYVNDKRATVEFSKKAAGVMTRSVSRCAYARMGGE